MGGAGRLLDTFHARVFRVCMKTITLTEEAYQRLKSWKTEPSESFSKVVLKAVPKRGTAADMEEGFQRLPALTQKQSDAVAASLAWANDWRNCPDPWTTPSVNEGNP
jgi:predicted CopG family antitoxin